LTQLCAVAKGDPMAPPGSLDTESDREMGLAGAGRAEKGHVLGFREKLQGREVSDVRAADRGLHSEVEVVDRLARGEMGSTDPLGAAVAVAGIDLLGQDCGKTRCMAERPVQLRDLLLSRVGEL